MADPEIQANGSKFSVAAREHGSLAKLATKYRKFKSLVEEVAELTKMAQSPDADEREMAEAELPEARAKREALWNELL